MSQVTKCKLDILCFTFSIFICALLNSWNSEAEFCSLLGYCFSRIVVRSSHWRWDAACRNDVSSHFLRLYLFALNMSPFYGVEWMPRKFLEEGMIVPSNPAHLLFPVPNLLVFVTSSARMVAAPRCQLLRTLPSLDLHVKCWLFVP